MKNIWGHYAHPEKLRIKPFWWIVAFIISIFLWILLIAGVKNCIASESPTIARSSTKTVKTYVDMTRIAMIESSNNPLAWNKRDDSRGLYQITPICLKEWNNFHSANQYTMNDLWDISINTEVASWYLNNRIPQMIKYYGKEDTIENRLIAYNAGIWYVKTGSLIPKITRKYILLYKKL